MSTSAVAHDETLILMAGLPGCCVMPHQEVFPGIMLAITRRAASCSPNDTNTELRTTSRMSGTGRCATSTRACSALSSVSATALELSRDILAKGTRPPPVAASEEAQAKILCPARGSRPGPCGSGRFYTLLTYRRLAGYARAAS